MKIIADKDYGKPVKAQDKVKCPYCEKMVSDVRLDQHIRAKHPGEN